MSDNEILQLLTWKAAVAGVIGLTTSLVCAAYLEKLLKRTFPHLGETIRMSVAATLGVGIYFLTSWLAAVFLYNVV